MMIEIIFREMDPKETLSIVTDEGPAVKRFVYDEKGDITFCTENTYAWWTQIAYRDRILGKRILSMRPGVGQLNTYRACYYLSPDGQGEVVLTAPEEAEWPDDQLIERAVKEAYDTDLIGTDEDACQISEAALRAGLRIGLWQD